MKTLLVLLAMSILTSCAVPRKIYRDVKYRAQIAAMSPEERDVYYNRNSNIIKE
mgnify:CR=1 FL=1